MATSKALKASAEAFSSAPDDLQKTAEAAWADGRYDDLIELSRGARGWPTVMSAFAHLRRNNPDAALAALSRVETREPHIQARAALLREWAMDVIERRDSGKRKSFSTKLTFLDSESAGLALIISAFTAFVDGRLDEARDLLESIALQAGNWVRGSGFAMLGWIEIRRFHLSDAHRYFLQATTSLQAAEIRDSFALTNALFGLATCALDGLNLGTLPYLRESIAQLPSRSDITQTRILCLSRVAQLSELSGDVGGAYDLLLDAHATRDSLAHGTEPLLELFDFHMRVGEVFSARHHRARAKKILDAIDWSNATIDERLFLLQLSTQFAADDHVLASKMFVLAVSAKGKIDTALVFEGDERARAFAMYAEGFLLDARGDASRAVESWRNAISIWAAIGYRFRAAQAEVCVLKSSASRPLTPNLDSAKRDAPNSWLAKVDTARRLRRTASPPDASSREAEVLLQAPMLGPAEQRVLTLICEGLSGPEIAQRVGRSLSTVKNQTIRIFRTYEVNDRLSLIRKARREAAEPSTGSLKPSLDDGTAPGPAGSHDKPAVKARTKGKGIKKRR